MITRKHSLETIVVLVSLLRSSLSFRTAIRHNAIGYQRPALLRQRGSHQSPSIPLQVLTDPSETTTKLSFDWNEQWYPAIPISYLDDERKPTAITILGKQLVVWKSDDSESGYSVLRDSCPHRRSPLSTGQVVKSGSTSCLMCRYHGWEFDAAGRCTKIPMNPNESEETLYPYKVGSFPTKVVQGLLWVYLGKVSKNTQLPDIPASALPSDFEFSYGSWEFFRFPMSYLSMVENSFDPAHALFTHQSMADFNNRPLSPTDALPMVKYYEVLDAENLNGGFTLQHTPFQQSMAKALGENSTTTRSFIPPCTVKSSSGFFTVKIWFVPSTPTETNVLAIFMAPERKIMKVAKPFPKIREFLSDCFHAERHWGDANYRFQGQDRLTMQGQDQRKPKDGYWWDLTPTPSDAGVAAFQKWIRTVGGLGPFPFLAQPSEGVALASKELSLWDSHAKYCPECRKTINRIAAVESVATKWSTGSLIASAVLSILTGLFTIAKRGGTSAAAFSSISCLVAAVGFRWMSEWAKNLQRRVYADGGDNWQKKLEIFGYNK